MIVEVRYLDDDADACSREPAARQRKSGATHKDRLSNVNPAAG